MNNHENRPNPEELLEAIKREEELKKGKLKIFLGMAAGVGKTYAMLEAAQKLRKNGVDVVAGIVDTHDRPETNALLEGLQIIPPQRISYRGKEFFELNLDEILKLRPQLVLVDELAHTNIPGSRNLKRWQDVKELLDAGIDVYTTLNVQHIESLKDVVQNITETPIRETVPDVVIETATFIQLVDITTDELLQRLHEGKVYLGDQSKIAADHFFKKDRLTALREIVLRYAAEKVDHDLHGMIDTVERIAGWKPREKLLVAISSSSHSQKLIRTARRLAFHLDAPWIALYVNNGAVLDASENNLLAKNIALARDLGAEVVTINDPDLIEGIKRTAHQRGITQIIIGRSPKRSILDIFRKFTLLDTLARECSDIDIHVIRQESPSVKYRQKMAKVAFHKTLSSYLFVSCFVGLLTCLNWFLLPYTGYKTIGGIFLIGILFLSLFVKKGPIFFASILYAIVWEFLFIHPKGIGFFPLDEDDLLLGLYFLTAIVTGILTDRAKQHKEMLLQREETIGALYEIMRSITTAPSLPEMLQSVKERLGSLLHGTFDIAIKKFDNGLVIEPTTPLIADEKEKSAAMWVFENGKEAGWSTTTLPAAQNLYIPLKGFHEVVGILVYRPKVNRVLTPEEKNFLYTVGQQLGNYLERSFSEERERQIEHLHEIDNVYQTILKSVSQEFQNPLLNIQEAVQTLEHERPIIHTKYLHTQVHKIEDSSEELMRILDNVSVMAKLSGGLIPINKSKNSIQTVVSLCYEKSKKILCHHKVIIHIQDNLPLLLFDVALIEILLRNLLCNAVEYSPPQSQIEIAAEQNDQVIIISVADQGKGIPPEMINLIFEQFYRVPGTTSIGMGLGLAIAKKIAEIHHGHLRVENRLHGGAKFSLFIPMSE